MLLDNDLHSLITYFSVLPRTESDHLPLVCELWGIQQDIEHDSKRKWTRYRWREDKKESFLREIHSETSKVITNDVNTCLECKDVEGALKHFTHLVSHVGSSMKMKEYKQSSQPPWWDSECEENKRIKY